MRGSAKRSLHLDRSRPLLSANWGNVIEPRRRLVKQAAKAARPENLVVSPLPREEGCVNPSDTYEERIWLTFTLVHDEPQRPVSRGSGRVSRASAASEATMAAGPQGRVLAFYRWKEVLRTSQNRSWSNEP